MTSTDDTGEVMLVPGGISHRSIGRNDSLRYFCLSHEAVDYVMGEDQYTSDTKFVVKRIGGPNWIAPQETQSASNGQVIEKMHFSDDALTISLSWNVTMTRWLASPGSAGTVREAQSESFELSTIYGDRRQGPGRLRYPAVDGIGG